MTPARENPTGRLDILLSRLLAELCRSYEEQTGARGQTSFAVRLLSRDIRRKFGTRPLWRVRA